MNRQNVILYTAKSFEVNSITEAERVKDKGRCIIKKAVTDYILSYVLPNEGQCILL